MPNKDKNTEIQQCVQPAVSGSFNVISDWQTNSKHFGIDSTKSLCGVKINSSAEIGSKVKIDTDKELKELRGGTDVNPLIWVKVAKYNYCQRCLSTLEKNFNK